jgi:predicted nucleic acid-binding protein
MIFDSSSIYTAVSNDGEKVLRNVFTLELARYEIGNILWKEAVLVKRYSSGEVVFMQKEFERIFESMRFVSFSGSDILRIAVDLRLSFYDAAYVNAAKTTNLPLVTEDKQIFIRAAKLVKIISFKDVF